MDLWCWEEPRRPGEPDLSGRDEAPEPQGENQTRPRSPKVSDELGADSTCFPRLMLHILLSHLLPGMWLV